MKRKFIETSKYLTISLVILTLIFSTVSCSSTPTENSQTTSVETNDPMKSTSTPVPEQKTHTPTVIHQFIDVDPGDLDGLSIRFVHPWEGEAGEVITDIALKFSLSNPWGIWVDVEGQGSENVLFEKVQTDIDQDNAPVLIAAHAYTLSQLEEKYAAIALTDYFNHPEWGMDFSSLEDIPQVYLDQYTLDGQLTALPIAPQAYVLFYNQTWGQVIGFDSIPTDEDSFTDQACGATAANLNDNNEENDYTGGFLMNFDPWVLMSWYKAFGGEVPKDEIPQFNNNAGQTAFSYLESLNSLERNCIWVGRQPEPYQYFANRYALMFAGTLDQIPLLTGWMDAIQNDDQWEISGFPGPEGSVMLVDGPGLFITESEPEAQLAAWLFAKYMLTPEVQARIVESMYTLPVRESAIDFLQDFVRTYPQWMDAFDLIDTAGYLPISKAWGYGRWILQDAINRSFVIEDEDISTILEQLDEMILEFEGTTP